MDPIKNIDVLGRVAVETTYSRLLTALIACVVIATLVVAQEGSAQMGKRKRKGKKFYRMVIHSNDVDCHDQIRMSRGAFFRLATILRLKGTLIDTIHLTLEEQLVMFLHTVGHNLRNHKIAHNFGHSEVTISRYFHKVLRAILGLHKDLFLPPSPNTPPEISGNERFDPFFKDCVRAIDGTHIPVTVDVDMQGKYHDRKGNLSQNVMGVCSFDHKFQYCLAGWEGSAADSHVLALALSRADPLVVPPENIF